MIAESVEQAATIAEKVDGFHADRLHTFSVSDVKRRFQVGQSAC